MSWWNSDWSYRKKLTIGNAAQGQLDNFTVLVHLDVGNFTFAHAKSAGADIRFVDDDDSAELKYEIEKWTDNTEAWIWVKVPTINGSSATDFIYMYFGNAAASDNQDAVNTWDANYKAVYHLHKASGAVVDSKGVNPGTNDGATRGQTGKIDNAFSFDGLDDRVVVPDNASLNPTAEITMEAWVKLSISTDDDKVINKYYQGIAVYSNKVEFHIRDEGNYYNTRSDPGGTILETDPTWYYIAGTYDGTTVKSYVNGAVDRTQDHTGDMDVNPDSLYIGALSLPGYTFPGIIDEVRISDIDRGADWLAAQYLSMTLDFISFGREEHPIIVTPGTLALTLTFHTPTVLIPRLVIPGTLALNLTFHTPSVILGTVVIPGTLALTLTPHIPIVTTTAYQVFVDGTHYLVRKDSRLVELRIEERSTARFTIVDEKEELSFQRGQPVIIHDFIGKIFGGVIDIPEVEAIAAGGGLYHHISCIDWHYLADKRLVALSFTDTAAGTIVSTIISTYLADEGVTEGTIEAGPDIKEARFNYVRASDCFDALAELSNKIWQIDEYKKLHFVARDTIEAPWEAASSDIIQETARLSGGNPLYRNRQYIRGGRATTTDLQTEKFIADGEQVAFTVGFPIASVPTVEVQGAGVQDVGIKGIDTEEDCYWNKGDATITFASDSTPAVNKWVEVKYYGLFNILVRVDNTDEIAARLAVEGDGTGIVEDIADEPTLDNKQASIDSGKAKLARFGVPGKRFLYQVTRTGLRPGMVQKVNYPRLGLTNEDLLIESVLVTRVGSQMFYDIIGIQGPEIGSWSKFFKALADMKHEVIDSLHIGSDQILIILADFTGNVEVSETITEPLVTACEFPSDDLFPPFWPC